MADTYLGSYVYCKEQHSGTVLLDGSADTGAIAVTVKDGDDVLCDWYNITKATDNGPGPKPKPPKPGKPAGNGTGSVTTLPETGTGAERGTTSGLLGVLGLGAAAAALLGKKLRGRTTDSEIAE